MGGLSFIIYNSKYKLTNKDFTTAFINSQHRGQIKTYINMVSSFPEGKINNKNIKLRLSRSEIENYVQYNFIYGYHSNPMTDESFDAVQPFVDPIMHKLLEYPELKKRQPRLLMCNGTIYNYNDLMKNNTINPDKNLQSNSDVEIILPLYINNGIENTIDKLIGDYSFVIADNLTTFDLKTLNVFAVRDILGTRPLYYIKHMDDNFFMFVSELKSVPVEIIKNNNYIISEVPPGTYWSFQNVVNKSGSRCSERNEFIKYFDWDYYSSLDSCTVTKVNPIIFEEIYKNIKTTLKNSIIRRICISTDSYNKPIGVLLSGGFDSCIILSILVEYLVSINHDFKKHRLFTFSIGDLSNDDTMLAQQCVDYIERKYNIDIVHHIVNINDNKLFIDNITNVIDITETHNIKIVRSGLIMYFLFKYIKEQTNVKILLTGEGLDELCGHTNLFSQNAAFYQKRSVEYIKNLHKNELLTYDKLGSFFGLELRHPFLDISFIKLILELHPILKMPEFYNTDYPKIEKYIIRKAFDIPNDTEYLPHDILWKSSSNITNCILEFEYIIKDYCNSKYTDSYFFDYVNNNPQFSIKTKEELLYIQTFLQKYPNNNLIKLKN